MPAALSTVVLFQSDLFNKKEPKEYFVNPDCFGDDLCLFIMDKLKAKGVICTEPAQEDWGWRFSFLVAGVTYDFNCGLRRDWTVPEGVEATLWDGSWICFVKRPRGFLSMFGREGPVELEACEKIHMILRETDGISQIMWHEMKMFERNNEELGKPEPW